MTDCNQLKIDFPACRRRRVEADFAGGDISSNGGAGLLELAERRLGLLSGLTRRLADRRQSGKVAHPLLPLLRQRVFAIALGYEDVNDHDDLRHDLVLQTACGRDRRLASASTVGRLERSADRAWAWAAHLSMVEGFIASFEKAPEQLILDFDATDDAVHGRQEGRFFHGYYDQYCFLPLYVFCGEQLLVSYHRPANIDGATHAWAILKLLVTRLRQAWPEVRIILRADSGFCRYKMLSWCERHGVSYIVGLAKNKRLNDQASLWMAWAAAGYEHSGEKQRLFAELRYGARSWGTQRRVIARLEHGAKGANPRYVVTNLGGHGQTLYDELYCQRGEMENRIKEQQLDLFADRTSCHAWWPNQFRLILASLAYSLMEAIRRLALEGTRMARAQAGSIRLKLLKIGAVVTRNTRRVSIHLSTACPDQELFRRAVARLKPG
ncbi:MAG: IS1380 family transposase [Proteobacteria bacterium]|nr:IS1380 family transposase [Pseudomonadota bacterium]